MDRRVLVVAAVLVLGGPVGCVKVPWAGTTGANTPDAAATPAPPPGPVEVTACGFDGVESAIAANRGKVVLVDCWATWCGPCVASFPKLVEKHQKYAGRGLAVISVSVDQPAAEGQVLAFLKRNNAAFTNLHLRRDAAAQRGLEERFAYRGAIPHAALLDKTGERVWAGHPLEKDLEQRIEAELAKPNPKTGETP